MKTLLHNLFILNWQRKTVALFLGVIIWLTVNHTLTSTKVITNVPIRVINLPSGKTIQGMQNNGRLSKTLNLTVVGNTNILNDLHSNDLEIVIDGSGQTEGWSVSISKKNLVSLNPEIDVTKGISKAYHPAFFLRITNLVTETIPVIATRPVGEPPRGYQFLDIWPYNLSVTVSGPEDVVKSLKNKEQKITFNLNDITKNQLDALVSEQSKEGSDVVSFLVPDQWKQIYLPVLSDAPFEIHTPADSPLRIDFLASQLIPLDFPIYMDLFYPPEYETIYNPTTLHLESNAIVKEQRGIFTLRPLTYARGCDHLFVQIIRNRIQISLIVTPPSQKSSLPWSVQFINPIQLEEAYVAKLMSDLSEENTRSMKPSIKEEYLRNRFRNYMNRFRLFTSADQKLELIAKIEDSTVIVTEGK